MTLMDLALRGHTKVSHVNPTRPAFTYYLQDENAVTCSRAANASSSGFYLGAIEYQWQS
jgi:hypothetical protein